MKFVDRIFNFEDKVKSWILNNRIKWCFFLFGVGILLGFFSTHKQGVGLLYGSLLVVIELTAGGEE